MTKTKNKFEINKLPTKSNVTLNNPEIRLRSKEFSHKMKCSNNYEKKNERIELTKLSYKIIWSKIQQLQINLKLANSHINDIVSNDY